MSNTDEINKFRQILESTQISIPDEIYDYINDLTSDDVGMEYFGDDWVLRFEGFSQECNDDADRRTMLPPEDPRHLSTFEDVYDEVLAQWKKEENLEPLDWGLTPDPEYPVQYAIFYKGQ